MVAHHRALPGHKGGTLCPAQAEAHGERAKLRSGVHSARVLRDVKAWDADAAALAHHRHAIIQHRGRLLHGRLLATAASLESNAVHGAIHGWLARDRVDLVCERAVRGDVDRAAAE